MSTPSSNRDPRVDAYIAKSADFARPILAHLREIIHEGCPQVTETLKWSMPSFEYKGILCGMAAFKGHCTFGFWKHALVMGDEGAAGASRLTASSPGKGERGAVVRSVKGAAFTAKAAARTKAKSTKAANTGTSPAAKTDEAMGRFGRITKLSDLPPKRVLLSCVRKAAKLNDDGVKIPRPPRGAAKKLRTPPDLAAALRKNKNAAARFADFSPSHRNEYIEWITEAKTRETRLRRLSAALEWIAEGKGRNWKYERK